jgi:hypothetical protein
LVEHHLAKVDVESSSLFACSIFASKPRSLEGYGDFRFPNPSFVLTKRSQSSNKAPRNEDDADRGVRNWGGMFKLLRG